MPRLFIGIPLADHSGILPLQKTIQKALAKSQVNWVAPENFHITLKFLGEVEDYYLNSLCQTLRVISREYGSFSLITEGLGYFGSATNPKVIWYGYQTSDVLATLVSRIDEDICQLGFPKEERSFHAHVTLGRVKRITERSAFHSLMQSYARVKEKEMPVDQFTLFKSELSPAGARYVHIEQFELITPSARQKS